MALLGVHGGRPRRPARRSGRSPCSRRSGRRCAGRSTPACRCGSATCRRRVARWPARGRDTPASRRAGRRERRRRATATRPVRSAAGRPPATTTRSAGGRTSSSTAGRDGDDLEALAVRGGRRGDGRGPGRRADGRRGRAHEEPRREAYMRTVLRAATKAVRAGRGGLRRLARARADRAAAAGHGRRARCSRDCRRRKVALTWVPWTHGRLASWPGYGAGVTSPGWYHHLFTAADRPVHAVAGRASPACCGPRTCRSRRAHVIEAVRLAEALATLRGRPLAGLAEVTEATRAVLCDGRRRCGSSWSTARLVVGERLGAVPDDTPAVPLAARPGRAAAPAAAAAARPLDARRSTSTCAATSTSSRSRLLHRLRLLGVAWGAPARPRRRGTGTFRETWRLRWQPEFAVDLVEASVWGTTVAGRRDREGRRTRRAAADSLARSPRWSSGACSPTCRDAYPPVLRRAGRPGRAGRRRRPT